MSIVFDIIVSVSFSFRKCGGTRQSQSALLKTETAKGGRGSDRPLLRIYFGERTGIAESGLPPAGGCTLASVPRSTFFLTALPRTPSHFGCLLAPPSCGALSFSRFVARVSRP